MSQLLDRLDCALKLAVDDVKRAEIQAKKACYLARVGMFSESREIILHLRRKFSDWRSGQITAWIMLAEDLLYLYEKLSPLAIDRVTRSQLLGLATNDRTIVALSSAWKAHIEFETSNFGMMIKSLQTALANARDDDHDAHARISMVICDSFLICGDEEAAQKWFLRRRDHALKDGDDSSIEALLYNRAAFSLAWLRAANCLRAVDEEKLSLVRLGIASDSNLQALIRIGAFTNFVHLCDARMLILEKKFEPAIVALETVRNSGPFAGYNFSQSFIDLEISFCLLRLHRIAEAREIFESIHWSSFDALDVDEQLVAAWMRHMMCLESDAFGDADDARLALEKLGTQYEDMRVNLLNSLAPFRGVIGAS